MLTQDNRHRVSTMRHTWRDSKEPAVADCAASAAAYMSALGKQESDGTAHETAHEVETENPISTDTSIRLRVMTYNLWHTNPPSWFVGSPR